MDKTDRARYLRELKAGLRLNIKKPPKAEIPKTVYTRKTKHKKRISHESEILFLTVVPVGKAEKCLTGSVL